MGRTPFSSYKPQKKRANARKTLARFFVMSKITVFWRPAYDGHFVTSG